MPPAKEPPRRQGDRDLHTADLTDYDRELMAFPTKGSRQLTVNGVDYRYIGLFSEKHRLPDEVNEFRVQLAQAPHRVLRAEFGYERLRAEYQRAGKRVSRVIDRVPPYVVRQTILLALAKGWDPSEPGSEFDLGRIDDLIDWSLLTPVDR